MANMSVYLLLGSNIEPRHWFLGEARSLLSKELGRIKAVSGIYQSAPLGFVSEKAFLNQALMMDTTFDPASFLSGIMGIEHRLGRRRVQEQVSDRGIDIDILFWGDQIIRTENLIVPHPRLHLRRFALEPMAELNSGLVHPVLGKSMKTLLDDCPDHSEVTLFEEGFL
jgi:2-amino-4-hydroxy-6-hydroxymethyldihydropteridine diphosphokinase